MFEYICVLGLLLWEDMDKECYVFNKEMVVCVYVFCGSLLYVFVQWLVMVRIVDCYVE